VSRPWLEVRDRALQRILEQHVKYIPAILLVVVTILFNHAGPLLAIPVERVREAGPLLYPHYAPMTPQLYPFYTPTIPLVHPYHIPTLPLLYPYYTTTTTRSYPYYTPTILLARPWTKATAAIFVAAAVMCVDTTMKLGIMVRNAPAFVMAAGAYTRPLFSPT
jgi:hypothetical protein